MPKLLRLAAVFSLGMLGCLAWAQQSQSLPIPSVSLGIGQGKSADEVNSTLQIIALLTVLSLAPSILILTTAFTRIVIVLSFLRTALGTQNIPPNQVIIGLSLFMTFFVMGPTYGEINDRALQPFMKKELTMDQALKRAETPLRAFMLKNTYEKDLMLFLNIREEKPETQQDVSLLSLVPAFIVSELKTAFIVGFYVFLPFLIIDLIVASSLMSMGMVMMPPVVVSLPAKILVFVLADGWSMIVQAIMAGYR